MEEEYTVEKMICYFIEANRLISNTKEKYLANYINTVQSLLKQINQTNIVDRINVVSFNKYFKDITKKWQKVDKDNISYYTSIVFNKLLKEYGSITEEKIIQATRDTLKEHKNTIDLKADAISFLLKSNIS